MLVNIITGFLHIRIWENRVTGAGSGKSTPQHCCRLGHRCCALKVINSWENTHTIFRDLFTSCKVTLGIFVSYIPPDHLKYVISSPA